MEPRNDEQHSTIDQWLAALDDRDWNTRATAVRMLGELGERAPLEPLLAALRDEDESVRAATVRALGKLGEHAPVDRLVVTLSDPSWMVREMAALTLGELGERAPTEALMDMLRAEHEDVFVREAAKMALQQAHPEVVPSLAQHAVSTSHTRDHSMKSSPAWLIGFAQRFFWSHTAMQKEGDLVETSDLESAASLSLPLPPPAPVRSRRSLPLRIAEGVLVALLLLGIGMSWLLLAQRLHSSSLAGPTPTASPIVSPSGPGHNVSITVVDGVVDVGTMDSTVYALRASDGGLLWRYQAAGPVGGPVASPPVVVDGIVYVNANVDQGLGYLTGYIYALRASDGTLLWRYTTGNFVYHGYVYSPTVANGVVYIASQAGSLTALRASDGALLWRYTAKGQVAVSLAANGIVYVLDTNIDQGPDYLEALRASDGRLLWRTPSYDYLPVVVNDVLYITSQAGLSALRARDGALLWRYALADTGLAGPTIVGGVLYTVAFNYSPDTTTSTPTAGYRLVTAPINWKIPFKQGGPSSLYALRASNGMVLWHYQTPSDKNNGMDVLAVAGGLVYIDITVGSSKTSISALRASDGSLLWTHAGDAPSDWAVVGQGVVYITSNSGVVYALQARDGKELWRYAVSGNVYSSPVLDGSTLHIGADNGVIYTLDASNGSLRWHYVTHTGS
jgi:outer membrane protein assembly factor BamB